MEEGTPAIKQSSPGRLGRQALGVVTEEGRDGHGQRALWSGDGGGLLVPLLLWVLLTSLPQNGPHV